MNAIKNDHNRVVNPGAVNVSNLFAVNRAPQKGRITYCFISKGQEKKKEMGGK